MYFKTGSSLAILCLFSVMSASASIITVGNLSYIPDYPTTGIGGFLVTNESNSAGCDATVGTPVCTILAFQNTSLDISYLDAGGVVRNVIRTPVAFPFVPGSYLYGFAPGESAAQQFTIDDTLNLLGATFSGSVSPAGFQITDSGINGNLSTFFSNGIFKTTIDLQNAAANGGSSGDITVDSAQLTGVPEPGSFLLMLAAGLTVALFSFRAKYFC